MNIPEHKDIDLYGYKLSRHAVTGKWYASHDTDKGTAWYKWNGEEFNQINNNCILDIRDLVDS